MQYVEYSCWNGSLNLVYISKRVWARTSTMLVSRPNTLRGGTRFDTLVALLYHDNICRKDRCWLQAYAGKEVVTMIPTFHQI